MPPALPESLLQPVARFVTGHPGLLPSLVGLVVLAWLVCAPTARRLRCGRPAAASLVLAATAPVVMTLTPNGSARVGARECLTALRPVSDWGRGGEELANLALLVPLGVLVVVLLPRRRVLPALLLGSAFGPVVELVQYAVPSLGRLCETTDAVLNAAGLALGALLGLLGLLVRLLRLNRARRGPGPRRSAWPGT